MKHSIRVLSCCLILFSCNRQNSGHYSHIEGFAQGTTYHISFSNNSRNDYTQRIDSILKDFDMSLSTYIPNSIISRINANDSTILTDARFNEVFTKSKQIWEQSGGLMDITVGPLIKELGFGKDRKMVIDSAKVKSLLLHVGFDKLRLENNRLIKSDTAIKLDVNSIAQGYSVDVICDFLDREGIYNYMVEIGGEVRAKGLNSEGIHWRVGIDKPTEGNLVPGENLHAIVSLKNQSLSTAGNYRNYHEINGVKYTHIVNPKTGFPARTSLLSVTIVARDCITADGWDTPLMVMGLEKGIESLKKHPELEALLIYTDEKGNLREYMTDGFKKMIIK